MVVADKLDFDILGDVKTSKKCLIFIHGWRGDKHSFKKVAQSFNINDSVWYLPQAPYLIKDQEGGYSWTYEISPGKYEREKPLKLLVSFFNKKIFSHFNSRDVFVFGFSQGGLVCYELLRVLDKPLGGVFPIAGFMTKKSKKKKIHTMQLDTPIMIGHGREDTIILKEESELAYKLLSKESNFVSFEMYSGGHKIGMSYIKKVKNLIES